LDIVPGLKKSSLSILQATAPDGKKPLLNLGENKEFLSDRKVNEASYLSV